MSTKKSDNKPNFQATKQNLQTLDKISAKMINELNAKNNILESNLNESKSFELNNVNYNLRQ